MVGSSRNSRLGLLMSSHPIASRFFSPPDSPRTFSSPTRVSRVWRHTGQVNTNTIVSQHTGRAASTAEHSVTLII